MKRLHLTVLRKELTEAAEKRLEELDIYDENPKDSNGKTREYYENLGLPVSKEITDKEKLLNGGIELTDDDYDFYETECTVNLDNFAMVIDDIEEGSSLFLSDGTFVNILEDSAEVNAQIWWLTRSKWEKFKEFISSIKRKFKKK